ncbi:MAG: metallophosphoesterase [Butyrivibrio sp.]|uniref:metallophosphoesterase n=1 Tax=Butyrivibrio sp. TaxID=28121 RepID=UPI001B55E7A0|nr:metallophosphoesterase [Butyrivibrio sp.]MBP3783275.1 metallophosphoesterase [Butyrivibrio sp.]
MGKVLVIPDVHLKTWMFNQALDIMENSDCENAVVLGDLVDDWGCKNNYELYEETMNAAISFAKRYPSSYWCFGNHDLSYLWSQYDHPGFSIVAADMVCDKFEELRDALETPENLGIIHRIDNTLFSHAGLSRIFVDADLYSMKNDLDCMIDIINGYGYEKLWEENSPIWIRPQYGNLAKGMFPKDLLQVVGHTPVNEVLVQDNLITVDTFSTTRGGTPIGNEEFIFVETVEKTWGYIDE